MASTTLSPYPCSYCPLVYNGTNLVLINCNNAPSYASQNISTWTFNGTNWALIASFPGTSTTNTQPPIRTLTSAVYDGTNICLFGGKAISGSESYLNDTWYCNSSSVWSQSVAPNTAIGTAPQARCQAYLAEQSSGTLVMWGGYDQHLTFTEANTMWQYGESPGWTSITATQIPPCRLNGSVASNGSSQVVFGFGARINGQPLNDVWSWSGTAWTQLTTTGAGTTSGAPSRRHSASMVYNSTTGNYILFGGADSSNNPINETWTMSTTGAFTKLSLTNSPSVRYGAQMQFMPGVGTILFGGLSGGQYPLTDTWLLAASSPTTWQRLF